MERRSETFGDPLQLFDGRVRPAATDTVQILFAPPQPGGQFCFTHVFFTNAFFKSIFVSFFIVMTIKSLTYIKAPPPVVWAVRLIKSVCCLCSHGDWLLRFTQAP